MQKPQKGCLSPHLQDIAETLFHTQRKHITESSLFQGKEPAEKEQKYFIGIMLKAKCLGIFTLLKGVPKPEVKTQECRLILYTVQVVQG